MGGGSESRVITYNLKAAAASEGGCLGASGRPPRWQLSRHSRRQLLRHLQRRQAAAAEQNKHQAAAGLRDKQAAEAQAAAVPLLPAVATALRDQQAAEEAALQPCVIPLDAAPEKLLVPCCHLGPCLHCLTPPPNATGKLVDKPEGYPTCLVCNSQVSRVIRILM